MQKTSDDSPLRAPGATGSRKDWRNFLLLAFVGLPAALGVLMVAYGFLVWFSQLLVFGPPT